MRERVSTVLFIFPDSREIRHMREPPRLGSRARSPRGVVWTVAQVVDYGSDTYTATCTGRTEQLLDVGREENSVRNASDAMFTEPTRVRDLTAELLQRVKDTLSPRAIKRRRRYRNYIP
jgi:hypothetical protein